MIKVQTELHLTEDQVELIIQRAILMGFACSDDPSSWLPTNGNPRLWSESLKKKAVRYVVQASVSDLLERGMPSDE